jgi:biopolymer transport protein ExbD
MSVVPERARRRAEINIVPLIDVLVTLIFFFLVSMQFRHINLLNLTLPQVESAGSEELTQRLEIAVAPDGSIYFQGTALPAEELPARIRAAARTNPNLPVLLIADENSLLRQVTFVMDTCRQAGLDTIRLQSR